MSRHHQVLAGGLAGIIISLLLVGIVSGTLVRHIVQIIPVALAFMAAIRGNTWAPYVAIPVAVFWLLIMVMIWLFLLGISRILTGHFTIAEIVLTIMIGIFSAGTLIQSVRTRTPAGWMERILAFIVFTVFQYGALWFSCRFIRSN